MSTSIQHEPGVVVPPIKIYPDKFSNHVVIVTGAASGIGEVTACLFAQQGAHVFLYDIDEANLTRVHTSIQSAGGISNIQLCDVGDEHNVTAAVASTVAAAGKIDVLAHLAGIVGSYFPLSSYPTEQYRKFMSTNLDGSFFLTRAVLPHMQQQKYGRIILTSSSTVTSPPPMVSAYVVTKAAVVGLARTAAVEAGPGVTVNVILPGLTDTPLARGLDNPEGMWEFVMGEQVVKRRGHALDQAHTICFIASPEASFFTGQVFECSGGQSFS